MNVTETPGVEPPRADSRSAAGDAGSAQPPKRLYRDPSGPVGGVAGGFAGYFDVDPVIPRLLWIVALFSGIGFPAYIVCWLVIPKAKAWPPPGYGQLPPSASQQHQTALLSGFVVLGLLAVIGTGADGLGQYLLPAALVGVGVYLLSQRPASHGHGVAEGEPSAEPPAAATGGSAWLGGTDAPRSGRAGLVLPTVLSALAIGAGIVAMLHAAGLAHVPIGAAAAGGLVIVGAGLVASRRFERGRGARGLVPLGIGLACVMLAAPRVESWFDDEPSAPAAIVAGQPAPRQGSGDVSFAPASMAELEPSYDLGAGKLTLDLTRLDLSQETREVVINVGVGKALVIVPQDAPVEVRADVGMGDANALGTSQRGFGASVRSAELPEGSDKLVLRLSVGIGNAEVRRGS